jgi:hypothetical protein
MATETRLYHVTDTVTGQQTLVEAAMPASARSIVTRDRFTVSPVNGIEAARLTASGVAVIWQSDAETEVEPAPV